MFTTPADHLPDLRDWPVILAMGFSNNSVTIMIRLNLTSLRRFNPYHFIADAGNGLTDAQSRQLLDLDFFLEISTQVAGIFGIDPKNNGAAHSLQRVDLFLVKLAEGVVGYRESDIELAAFQQHIFHAFSEEPAGFVNDKTEGFALMDGGVTAAEGRLVEEGDDKTTQGFPDFSGQMG